MNLQALKEALGLVLLVALAGCSGDAPRESAPVTNAPASASPSQTVEKFLEAIQRDDRAVFTALLTEASREALAGGEGLSFSSENLDGYDVGAESIRDATAEVAVEVHHDGATQDARLLLRRENGLWRIHGMRVAFGEGELTLDFEAEALGAVGEMVEQLGNELGQALQEGFEQAFEELEAAWAQGGTSEEIIAEAALFESLAAVSRADFDAAWRTDVVAEGQSGAQLLDELLRDTGLALDAGEHDDALALPLSFELRGVSRIQAIERVAREAGLYPVWPSLRMGFGHEDVRQALTFAQGERALPAQFVGPFLIEITDLDEHAPSPVGSIEVTVRALGLSQAALAYQSEMGEVVHVAALRNAAGEPLTDEEMHHWGTPDTHGTYFTYSLEKELSGLLRGVETIAELSGEVRFTVPVDVEELSLEPGAAPATRSGRIQIGQWGKDVRFDLAAEADASLEAVSVRMSPRKADGAPLGTLYSGANGWGSKLQASLQCPEPPAAVEMKLCREEHLTYAFRFDAIPLQRFAEQPERLAPLTFRGVEPVRGRLVGAIRREGDQAEITIELENTSNKDAHTVVFNFVYLDAAGNKLEDFPHTLMGNYDFERQAAGPVVTANQTVLEETFAAFLPQNAASIRFELSRAEFPDGTSWTR